MHWQCHSLKPGIDLFDWRQWWKNRTEPIIDGQVEDEMYSIFCPVISNVVQLTEIDVVEPPRRHLYFLAADMKNHFVVRLNRNVEPNLSKCEVCCFVSNVAVHIDTSAGRKLQYPDTSVGALECVEYFPEIWQPVDELSTLHTAIVVSAALRFSVNFFAVDRDQ